MYCVCCTFFILLHFYAMTRYVFVTCNFIKQYYAIFALSWKHNKHKDYKKYETYIVLCVCATLTHIIFCVSHIVCFFVLILFFYCCHLRVRILKLCFFIFYVLNSTAISWQHTFSKTHCVVENTDASLFDNYVHLIDASSVANYLVVYLCFCFCLVFFASLHFWYLVFDILFVFVIVFYCVCLI